MTAAQWITPSQVARTWLAGMALGAASMGVGWLMPQAFDTAVNVQAPVSPPVFVHPGAVLGEAARRFNAGDFTAGVASAPGEEPDTSIEVNRPPPAPDIAELFRRDLTAVVAEAGTRVVVVIGEDRTPRRLAEGAIYRDGWRLVSIGAGEVVLRRRGEMRRIETMRAYASRDNAESGDVAAQPQRRLLSRKDARRTSQ